MVFAAFAIAVPVVGVSVMDMTAASAATYYVSNSGSDGRPGTSPKMAWRTVSHVNAHSFKPGDFVLFRAGGIWRETLVPSSSGSAGHPITFGSYGAGHQPVISGANLEKWTQGTLYHLPPTVWRAARPAAASLPLYTVTQIATPPTVPPFILNFAANKAVTPLPSSCMGVPVASPASLTSPHQWTWDANYVYVYSTANPASTVEIPTRENAVTVIAKGYLTFSGLDLRGAQGDGMFIGNPDYATSAVPVANNTIPMPNLTLSGDTLELNYGDGWRLQVNAADVSNGAMSRCVLRYNGGSGMVINAHTWTNWTVNHNQAYYNSQVAFDDNDVHAFSAGLHAYSGARDGSNDTGHIATGGAGSVWSDNLSYDNGVGAAPAIQASNNGGEGMGIHMDCVTGQTVTRNTVYGNASNGILGEKNTNSKFIDNVVYGNSTRVNYSSGIGLVASQGTYASGNLVANNTVCGNNDWGIYSGTVPDGTLFYNNTIENNIVIGSAQQSLYAGYGGDNDGTNGHGNVYSHNALGPERVNLAVWVKAGALVTTYSQLDSVYGSPMHNLQSDPLLVNPAGADFHLQPGSPAIGAGVFIPGVSTSNPPNLGALGTISTPSK